MYQRLLLQTAGFVSFALLVVPSILYRELPFITLGWIRHLSAGDNPASQWLGLILILFCCWLIWRGGQILVKSSPLYSLVCSDFDKGLLFLFLLLIAKAFIATKLGLNLPDRDIIFVTIAYLVFGLTALSTARNRSDVERSFLDGRRGIGIILSVVVTVTLLGTGAILFLYPYLFSVADSLLFAMKDASGSIDSVVFRTLVYFLRRSRPSPQIDGPGADTQPSTDPDQQPMTDRYTPLMEEEGSLLQLIAGWGVFGVVVLVSLAALAYFLSYILRLLLKRNRPHIAQPLFIAWIWNLLLNIKRLSILFWHGWMVLLRGVDRAATAYAGLIRWGRWCGLSPNASETPAEYGRRLVSHFPGLRNEIELIVDAFNREVYGQSPADRKRLARLRAAQRRMQHFLLWPSRIKVWFFQ